MKFPVYTVIVHKRTHTFILKVRNCVFKRTTVYLHSPCSLYPILQVIHLQSFAEGWGEGGFQEKSEERPCIETPHYDKINQGHWKGTVLGRQVKMMAFKCVSVLGFTRTLIPLLQDKPGNVRWIS